MNTEICNRYSQSETIILSSHFGEMYSFHSVLFPHFVHRIFQPHSWGSVFPGDEGLMHPVGLEPGILHIYVTFLWTVGSLLPILLKLVTVYFPHALSKTFHLSVPINKMGVV